MDQLVKEKPGFDFKQMLNKNAVVDFVDKNTKYADQQK